MNITWPNFNRNQLILLVSGGIIVLLLMYALLRDSTDTISLAEASHLIGAGTVDHAVMDGEYAYLSTRDYGVVKIQSAQLPHELISQLKIEHKSSYGPLRFFCPLQPDDWRHGIEPTRRDDYRGPEPGPRHARESVR